MPLVFQSAWLSSDTCSGPPSSMYLFSTEHPTPVFNFEENWDYHRPHCGLSPVEYPIGCCLSSVDLSMTEGYSSFSANFLDSSLHAENAVPVSTGNAYYCSIISADYSSLWGYEKAWVIANQDCVNGIQCSERFLNVYNDTQCTTPLEQYFIPASSITVSSRVLGAVNVSVVQTPGYVNMDYTGENPSWEAVPNYKSYLDYFTYSFYVFSVFATLLTVIFYSVKFALTKSTRTLYFVLTQSLWMLKAIIQFYYTFTPFKIMAAKSVVYFFVCWLRIASLFSTLINVMLVFDIQKSWKALAYQLLAYGGIVFVHFCLCALNYISPFLHLFDRLGLALDTALWSQTLLGVWNVLQFMFGIIPPFMIYLQIVGDFAARKCIDKHDPLNSTRKRLAVIFSIQLLNAICFTIIQSLLDGSTLVNSDKLYRMFVSLQSVLLTINSIIILVVFEMLTALLLAIKNTKYKPTRLQKQSNS